MQDKKKRILFIQTQAENAGAQEISRLLGEGLEKRGHEVHHFFFYKKSETFNAPLNTKIISAKRPSSLISFCQFYYQLIKEIKNLNPDCIFTFQHFGNVIGALAAKMAGHNCIIANQVSARETIHPVLRGLDLLLGLSFIYQTITVNSDDLKKDYEKYPKTYLRKMLLVPHGFEDKSVPITKQEARIALKLPTQITLLGTAARLNPMKQIDLVIDLLKKQPDWHLAIAGQGPDEQRLKDHATHQKVAERVFFLGEIAPKNIGIFLKSLDVFVFPSMAETFGLAAVEAAQAGIPVVANDLPVLQEVLQTEGEKAALFVDVKQKNNFEKALLSVLQNHNKRNRLINAGLKLRDKYSLTKMVDAYEAIALKKPLEQWKITEWK